VAAKQIYVWKKRKAVLFRLDIVHLPNAEKPRENLQARDGLYHLMHYFKYEGARLTASPLGNVNRPVYELVDLLA